MRLIASVALLLLAIPTIANAAKSNVHLEIVTERGIPIDAPQQWMQTLKRLDLASLRIRSRRPGDSAGIERRGAESSPSFFVRGILSADNRLILPGGKFRRTEFVRLADWIDKLEKDGEKAVTANTGAFGLTEQQLVDLFTRLQVKVAASTRNVRIDAVVSSIQTGLDVPVLIDRRARRALDLGEIVIEELSGLSSGTVLTATLRPLGLVVVPQKERGRPVQLLITDVRNAPESWPVGWPPEGQNAGDLVPKLLEYVRVEINDTPLSEALSALQARLEIPFLMDQNSIARHRIDPATIKVKFPAKRTYYKRLLDQLLHQAGLQAEVRVDEAQQPFIWISASTP